MSNADSRLEPTTISARPGGASSSMNDYERGGGTRIRMVPTLVTLSMVGLAALAAWAAWEVYMARPWTRDGTVRAYAVTMAPSVAGRIVKVPVTDNQFVHKDDLLMVIDPTDYKIAERLAEAAAQQAQASADNAESEARRRREQTTLSVTVEERQSYESNALAAKAQYQQAVANLDQAKVNLARTEIRSPVDGWVTNLSVQYGDYATVGQSEISLIDANSFWVDGYFEETNVDLIREGDQASIKLIGHSQILRGHVDGIARGVNVPNAQPNGQGLATVNPIFTWVRLAQRIPVHIHIDQVPQGIVLAAGRTATVEIDPQRQ